MSNENMSSLFCLKKKITPKPTSKTKEMREQSAAYFFRVEEEQSGSRMTARKDGILLTT
jgi:hypothetical protein